MCDSISKKSIRKANCRMGAEHARSFTSDGKTASIRCSTVTGKRMLTVSTDKIIRAANNVWRKG